MLLGALAAVFLFFYTRWPESGGILAGAYILLCAVAAFSSSKDRSMRRAEVQDRRRPRQIWPETQVKLFVNAIPEPSAVLDSEGVVRHVNGPMRDAFGSIAQGDPFTLKFRDPDIVGALAKVATTGSSVSVPYMVRFPTERHYLIHFSPIALPRPQDDGPGIDFIFAVMLEQTERFRLEELRSDFIANVSHELRTPVASLIGFIETLLGPARDDAASRERFLAIMLEQAQRMARLVNDLLSLSRIEMRSHVRPTGKVDLASLVSHVADAMKPLADEAGIALSLALDEPPLTVTGEWDELVQAVQNLVENACKYGADGGRLEISVRRTEAPAGFDGGDFGCCMIEVRDYGKGIASEHLPRLTERFYRVDTQESKRKMGTGLGLAVVKHIVARHQAHLKIASAIGQGSSFRIYLKKLPS